MTQEEKSLLLQDLCARLPYGVKVLINSYQEGCADWIGELSYKDLECFALDVVYKYVKPYLRSMSSMTEEERFELEQIIGSDVEVRDDYFYFLSPSVKRLSYAEILAVFAWLLKYHFDFMGLIPKNLAIEVNKENNPYKN